MADPCWHAMCPDFYTQFHCIGPACSDNCCHGWPIEIDKAHYLRYQAETNPAFTPLREQNIHRKKKDASRQRYARLRLDSEGRCGFQDPDGGCKLIRALGEDALCTVCALYPRRKAEFSPGKPELSLSMSCEQAVRIGVLQPFQITFQQQAFPLRAEDPMLSMEPVGIGGKGSTAAPPSWGRSLRMVCIRLMQSREWTIPQRIAAVLLLLRRLDKLRSEGQEDQIPGETIRFLQALEQSGMSWFFQGLDYHREAHTGALQIPMGHLLSGRQEQASRDFLEMLAPWCRGDGSGGLLAGREAAEFLLDRIGQVSDPLLAQHPAWTENFFVNYLFSSMFPFLYLAEGRTLEDHGLLLIQQYGLLRCLLAASQEEASHEQRFLRAFVHTARLSQHGDFAADTEGLLRSLHTGGTAHMLYLLR